MNYSIISILLRQERPLTAKLPYQTVYTKIPAVHADSGKTAVLCGKMQK